MRAHVRGVAVFGQTQDGAKIHVPGGQAHLALHRCLRRVQPGQHVLGFSHAVLDIPGAIDTLIFGFTTRKRPLQQIQKIRHLVQATQTFREVSHIKTADDAVGGMDFCLTRQRVDQIPLRGTGGLKLAREIQQPGDLVHLQGRAHGLVDIGAAQLHGQSQAGQGPGIQGRAQPDIAIKQPARQVLHLQNTVRQGQMQAWLLERIALKHQTLGRQPDIRIQRL